MAFDPTKPAANSANSSAEMRAQLNGLKALIDAVPVITGAVVDAVNTLPPGSPAAAAASLVAGLVRFTFELPAGPPGATGATGETGSPGAPGAQGPPFASVVVDAVNTLPSGSPAAVTASLDGNLVRLTFDLPAGADGTPGTPGPAGEVTQAALDAALLGTSANSNAVAPLGLAADGSYNPAQMQDLLSKVDELILALRR